MKYLIFYFLGLLSLTIFLKGFFPTKNFPANYADDSDFPNEPNSKKASVKSKQHGHVDRLVWIVIDAMRLDFLTDPKHLKRMPFLKKTLEQGQAKLYKSVAKAPTVTLPRIKALTSGSLTGFVDALQNMNQLPEFKSDNIIYQIKKSGKKLVFYGDDTWLRLFPNHFIRSDGTTSFFVNDYTQVDENVTRHIDGEMLKTDWDVLILHYLGLDHIGHISGPSSTLVHPKLSEMDSVLYKICSNFLKTEKTGVILTSDHGMGGGGSHGGTSDPEINTPFVLIRSLKEKKFEISRLETIDQIDIAPSISLMMGLPIPRVSMGKTIFGAVQNMNNSNQLSALQYNTHQLVQLMHTSKYHLEEASASCYKRAFNFHSVYLEKKDEENYEKAKLSYLQCQEVISSQLTSKLASYNYYLLSFGITLTFVSFSALLTKWVFDVIRLHRIFNYVKPSSTFRRFSILLGVGTLIDIVLLAGSSFVEEQHQTWQFLTSSISLFLFLGFAKLLYLSTKQQDSSKITKTLSLKELSTMNVRLRKDTTNRGPGLIRGGVLLKFRKLWQQFWLVAAFAFLFCHRILKSWNQTGIKYIDNPDIGDWLTLAENNSFLSLVSIISLAASALLTDFILTSTPDYVRSCCTWISFLFIYIYRSSTRAHILYGYDDNSRTASILQARIVYLMIILLLVRSLVLQISSLFASSKRRTTVPSVDTSNSLQKMKSLDCLQSSVIIISGLLLRPHNHTLLAINLFMYVVIMKVLWPNLVEEKPGILKHLLHLDSKEGYDDWLEPWQACGRIILAYWFGRHAYFTFGNSNGFASLDLSSAYVGFSSDSDSDSWKLVSILLCIYNTYSGPIVWLTLTIVELIKTTATDIEDNTVKLSTPNLVLSTLAMIKLLTISFYLAIVFGHRYHLFVWSVFAPKLIYEYISTCVYSIILTSAAVYWR